MVRCEHSVNLCIVILCLYASSHACAITLASTALKATTAFAFAAAKPEEPMSSISGFEHDVIAKATQAARDQAEARFRHADVQARLDWLCEAMRGQTGNFTGPEITLSHRGVADLSLRPNKSDSESTADWNISCYAQAVQPARAFAFLGATPNMQCRVHDGSSPCPCRLISRPKPISDTLPEGIVFQQDGQCAERESFTWIAVQWLAWCGLVYMVWQCTSTKKAPKKFRQRRSTTAQQQQGWSIEQLVWSILPRKFVMRHLQVALPVAVFGTGIVISWLVLKAGVLLTYSVVSTVSSISWSFFVTYLLPFYPIVTLLRFLTGYSSLSWPGLSCLISEEELQILRESRSAASPSADSKSPAAIALPPDRLKTGPQKPSSSKEGFRATGKASASNIPKQGLSEGSLAASPGNVESSAGAVERKVLKGKDAAGPSNVDSSGGTALGRVPRGLREATKAAKVSSPAAGLGTATKSAATNGTPAQKGAGVKDAGSSSSRSGNGGKNRSAARQAAQGRVRASGLSAPASAACTSGGAADDAALACPTADDAAPVCPTATQPGRAGPDEMSAPASAISVSRGAADDVALVCQAANSCPTPPETDADGNDATASLASVAGESEGQAELNEVSIQEADNDDDAAGNEGDATLDIIEKGKTLEDAFAKSGEDPVIGSPTDADVKIVSAATEPESEPLAEPAAQETQSTSPKEAQDDESWLEQRGQRRRRRTGQPLVAKAPTTEKEASPQNVHTKQQQPVFTDQPVAERLPKSFRMPAPPSGPAPAPPTGATNTPATGGVVAPAPAPPTGAGHAPPSEAVVSPAQLKASGLDEEWPALQTKPVEDRRIAAEQRLVERIAMSTAQRKVAVSETSQTSEHDAVPVKIANPAQKGSLNNAEEDPEILGQWIASTSWSCHNVSNVLEILSGQRLQVIDAQGGWAYGHTIELADKLGWFPRFLLKQKVLAPEPRQLTGQVVRLIRDYKECDHPRGGYLSVSCGEEVQIKYQDEDLHWCYGCASDGSMGWLPEAICEISP